MIVSENRFEWLWMHPDERQREITIKSKKGTSPGFQVSELLEANTITMQYNALKYKYTYKYNMINDYNQVFFTEYEII